MTQSMNMGWLKNTTEAPRPSSDGARLVFIDGLRGVAAASVVLYHLVGRVDPQAITRYGYLGVAVFFVLSGYVITMIVDGARVNWKYLGRFALRRSLRLDPPYWASIALTLALAVIAQRMGVPKTFPSLGDVALHLFYLQDLVGVPPISPVYWTLCFEVQFYLTLIALCWMRLPIILTAALGLVSLAAHAHWLSLPHGLFVPVWFCFALGAFCFWTRNRLKPVYFWLAVLVVLVSGDEWNVVAAMTATAIYAAQRLGKMQTWLRGSAWQFIGRISYSLYLFHPLVGWSAQSMALRFMGPVPALVIGIVVSVISAWIAYRLVEKPAIALSRWATTPREKRKVSQPAAGGAPVEVRGE